MSRPPQLLLHLPADWAHHGEHSGLAPMRRALAAAGVVLEPVSGDRATGSGVMVDPLLQGDAPYCSPSSLRADAHALNRAVAAGRQCSGIFVESLENHLPLVAASPLQGLRLHAISHQPPAWWLKHASWLPKLSVLENLFVFSESAHELFSSWLPPRAVTRLQHGVDYDFFCPSADFPKKDESQPLSILFCGSWFRDFEMLDAVICGVAANRPYACRFDLVLCRDVAAPPGTPAAQHAGLDILVHRSLSDQQLLELYRQSDLVFLPLTDCTACNTLLEAMATGTRVLATRAGSVPDYAASGCIDMIAPHDAGAAIATILHHARHRRLYRSSHVSKALRNRALACSWERTAARMAALF